MNKNENKIYMTTDLRKVKLNYIVLKYNKKLEKYYLTKNAIKTGHLKSGYNLLYIKKDCDDKEIKESLLNIFVDEIYNKINPYYEEKVTKILIKQTLLDIPMKYLFLVAQKTYLFNKATSLFVNIFDLFNDCKVKLERGDFVYCLQCSIYLVASLNEIDFTNNEYLFYELKRYKSTNQAYNFIRDDNEVSKNVKRIIRDYNNYRNDPLYYGINGETVRDPAVELLYFANELLTY